MQICSKVREHKLFASLLLITVITIIMMIISFEYCDVDSLTVWSVNVWDIIFSKEYSMRDFYSYCELNLRGAVHQNCAGNYLWLLPWSVWNLPIWIVHTITDNMIVTDFWSICWSKLFLVFLTVLTAWKSYQICMYFNNDKRRSMWIYILILASPELLMSIGYAGQDEILYLGLFIFALYYYLKNKMARFLICAIYSVTCCPLMLIPVLAMVFLKEKKAHKILLYAGSTLMPLVVFELFYRNDILYQSSKTDFASMISSMFQLPAIGTIFGEASIAGVLLIVIYFYCYNLKLNEIQDADRWIIYVLTVIFMLMSTLMDNPFYRLYLYVPVLMIFLIVTEKNYEINTFLVLLLTCTRTFFACLINEARCMNTMFVMKNSWITNLCDAKGNTKYLMNMGLVKVLMSGSEYSSVIAMLFSMVIVACTVLILVINWPNSSMEYSKVLDAKICFVFYTLCMPLLLLLFYKTLLF